MKKIQNHCFEFFNNLTGGLNRMAYPKPSRCLDNNYYAKIPLAIVKNLNRKLLKLLLPTFFSFFNLTVFLILT